MRGECTGMSTQKTRNPRSRHGAEGFMNDLVGYWQLSHCNMSIGSMGTS